MGLLGKGEGETIDQSQLKSRIDEIRKLIPYIKITKREKLDSRLENKTQYEDFIYRRRD